MYVCSSTSFFFCLKASLPDDMLSSESMSSSINKPLKINFQVELDTEGPHKTRPSLGCSERKGLRMISNVSSSRYSSDIPIDIYIYIYMYMYNIYIYIMYGCTTPIWLWAKTFTSTYPGISWGRPAARAPMVPMDPSCRHPWLWPTLMWVKQCHKPPTTGNDLNWWFGGMVWLWLFYKQ